MVSVAVPLTLGSTVTAAMLAIIARGVVVHVVTLITALVVILLLVGIEDEAADIAAAAPAMIAVEVVSAYAGRGKAVVIVAIDVAPASMRLRNALFMGARLPETPQ